ncbi:MAG: hypothetical protein Q9191_001417 [Dirinaria sp. TL-2023a]
MDFASLMSSAIKTSSSTSPSNTTTSISSPANNQKYLKRSDLEAQRQAAYLQSQRDAQAAREAKAASKRKHEEEEAERAALRNEKRQRLAEESRVRREAEEDEKARARRKRLGLPELPVKDGKASSSPEPAGLETEKESENIAPEELIQQLRALDEPAILFGESHLQRFRRLKKITAPKAQEVQLSKGPIPTTLTLLPESSLKVPPIPPPASDKSGREYLYQQLASYFTLVLTEWISALASRTQAVKESSQGRAAENAMLQSRENMRPLFKKFESGDLADAILEPVVEIVHAAQERRYVDANDGYLRLSIGKAAWPIGVTMVGIHERSAREKLHESDKGAAHIMSDEVTRKFLQSIKRCLSFAQTRWPPEDIGQMMG